MLSSSTVNLNQVASAQLVRYSWQVKVVNNFDTIGVHQKSQMQHERTGCVL